MLEFLLRKPDVLRKVLLFYLMLFITSCNNTVSSTPVENLRPTIVLCEHFSHEGMSEEDKAKSASNLQENLRTVVENPLNAEAHLRLGTSYYSLNSDIEAVKSYSEAIRLDPNCVDAYHNRGVSNHQLENFSDALSDYNMAINLSPDFALAYVNRGRLYGKQDNYELALHDYSTAITLEPNSSTYRFLRGLANHNLENRTDAITDFSEVIRIDPNYADAYVYRGANYGSLGQHDAAIADFYRHLELNPSSRHRDYIEDIMYERGIDITNSNPVDTVTCQFGIIGQGSDAEGRAINIEGYSCFDSSTGRSCTSAGSTTCTP